MPSSSTARNRFEKQGTGDNTNTWGQRLNTTGLDLIDEALDGYEAIPVTGNLTLSSTNYSSDQARKRFLKFTGSAPATITIPSVSKLYFIWNATTDNLIVTTGGGTVASLAPGAKQWVACDGVGVYTDTSMPIAVAAAASAAFSAANAEGSAESALASSSSAQASASSATASASSAAGSATAAAQSAASVNASNLVDRSTAQTIGGLKTFTDGVRINSQTLDGLTAFGVSLAEASDATAANTLLGSRIWTLLSSGVATGASIAQTGLANYSEVLLVLDGVSNNGGVAQVVLYGSTDNGGSYPNGIGVTASVASSSALNAAVYGILLDSVTVLVPADSTLAAPTAHARIQTSKVNAVRINWDNGALFDAGNYKFYAR